MSGGNERSADRSDESLGERIEDGSAARGLQRELETAIALARSAGERVLAIRSEGFAVDYKLGEEPVTRADREASTMVVGGLLAAFPTDVVISEELEIDLARTSADRVWYVDPIDGTRDFIRGDDGFAVMIGLCIGGVPVLGVVYQPTRQRTYYAVGGGPALLIEPVDAGLSSPRRLSVSAISDPRESRLAASASHRSDDIDRVKKELGIRDELNVGSVGLKLCLIAAGSRDLYVNPAAKTKAWDTCAPQVILAAAGGKLTDLYGVPVDYRCEDLRHHHGLVGSNGHLHDAVVLQMAKLFPHSSRPFATGATGPGATGATGPSSES
jgi:3'(2'), 5'-bisphosphate nucleotidase